MSIIFAKNTNFHRNDNKNWEANVEYYKGMVIATTSSYVWDYYYVDAIVYDMANDEIIKVPCGGDYCLTCNITVDATEEVKAAYNARVRRDDRNAKAAALWNQHNSDIKRAHTMQLSLKEMKKLRDAYSTEHFEWVFDLLKTKKFRNTFRQSMNDQVRAWVKETEPKFPRPLSPKQLSYLRPYRAW